jgi:type II secretory pathway predicted ATPase ExeA
VIDKMQTYFGFTAMPSGRDLTPAMLHRHASHAEAAARIAWTIGEKTLAVVTGEVGTGKTVAARAALAAADPTRHTVIYIGNPATGGIHHHIVTALGGRPVHGTAALTAQAYDVLAGEAAERGRTPVLIIDEAHLPDHDQLESIRMLTNHDMDSRTPFATILLGTRRDHRRVRGPARAAAPLADLGSGQGTRAARRDRRRAGHAGVLLPEGKPHGSGRLGAI